MSMTLKAWKEYFKASYLGVQRGPNDVCGWNHDQDTKKRVEKAKTWEALIDSVPSEYYAAAVNRCKISEL